MGSGLGSETGGMQIKKNWTNGLIKWLYRLKLGALKWYHIYVHLQKVPLIYQKRSNNYG